MQLLDFGYEAANLLNFCLHYCPGYFYLKVGFTSVIAFFWNLNTSKLLNVKIVTK